MSDKPDIKKIKDCLWSSSRHEDSIIYVILDAAVDEVIYSKIVASDIEVACLYDGDDARQLEDVAPYLVKLYKDDPFTDWVLENGWGKHWGIFLESFASLEELKFHFREFIVAVDEKGKQMYFRYYDPRVFRVYLPTCNRDELNLIFRKVNRFLVESDKKEIFKYNIKKNQLWKIEG
jgi:hypothetical protein